MEGIGIDIVEMERMRRLLHHPLFIERVLTKKEQNLLLEHQSEHRQVEFLAGRYACKEAFSKAYGTGIGEISFQDMEILRNEKGAPYFSLSPYEGKVFVSISHTNDIAIAQVYLEK